MATLSHVDGEVHTERAIVMTVKSLELIAGLDAKIAVVVSSHLLQHPLATILGCRKLGWIIRTRSIVIAEAEAPKVGVLVAFVALSAV